MLYSGSFHTDHDMYLVLANFMVYKPALDLQEVPLFYLLVHSSSNQVSVYFTVLYVIVRARTSLIHTPDFDWLMTWNVTQRSNSRQS